MAHPDLAKTSMSLSDLDQRQVLAGFSTIKKLRQEFAATENAQRGRLSQLATLGPGKAAEKIPRRIDIIEGDHPLVAAWGTINPKIHRILRQHKNLESEWITIDTLRIGYHVPDAPMPVTINVSVDKNFDPRGWAEAEWQLRQMLDAHGFMGVGIILEHGEWPWPGDGICFD
ncbi:MAG: hypothetical protein LQ337_006782 [Flavoplaca oasis]|nr:MAG: hypothetical protein LQ337_006782 [Flavoplaca oasis]